MEAILNKLIRIGFIEKGTFEQRTQVGEFFAISIWERAFHVEGLKRL